MIRRIETGGIRNEKPLSDEQIQAAKAFAVSLGMPAENIAYSENGYWTGYNADFDLLLLGTDLYPATAPVAKGQVWNSRVSWKGTIGHELIGHREAALKGWTQSDDALEEAQASIRAARFTPDLTYVERIILLRDAISRLPKGVKIQDVKAKLHIIER